MPRNVRTTIRVKARRMTSGRMNQGAGGRPRRRSQLRTRPLGESEKRWLMGEARREVRRVVQRGSCDVAARDARCAEIAHEVYATPRDSVTGASGAKSCFSG